MNWIIASFLMFFSSIIYYLIIKKAQVEKIESKLYMVANFSIPTLLYFFLARYNNINLVVGVRYIVAIFLISLFLNYIGSVISYFGMIEAPNAGYSVVVQKSYAIYTSIAAIFLFHSPLPLNKFLAILVIVFFTALLTINPSKKLSFKNYRWVVYSFIAFFCFGSLRLGNKLVISLGVPTLTLLFWAMLFTTLISLIDLLINKKSVKTKIDRKSLIILFGIGLSVSSFYYFAQVADVIAPNIGYSGAINAASNAFYTLIVALMFKDHLSWKKFLAILGVTAGIIFLVL